MGIERISSPFLSYFVLRPKELGREGGLYTILISYPIYPYAYAYEDAVRGRETQALVFCGVLLGVVVRLGIDWYETDWRRSRRALFYSVYYTILYYSND